MTQNASNAINDPETKSWSWCDSVIYLEITYQIIFFLCGTPVNFIHLFRTVRLLRSRHRHLVNTTNRRTIYLKLNLTVSNLIILCIYCTSKTSWELTYFWYGGELTCQLFKFFGSFAYHSWSNIVVVIALDMWFCVSSPMKTLSKRGNIRIKVRIIYC